MYLKRKADIFFESWKNDAGRLPLIVKGARQVGKTASILYFAEKHYSNIININFALETKYLDILEDGYDVGSIIKRITLHDPEKEFIPGETLILFDELQELPDVATCLKSFAIDKRFDVICSGSLLGIHYRKIHSNSVGYKTDFEMRSMDFEEFLWARGYGDDIIADILRHMTQGVPFFEGELRTYDGLFMEYCVLGGMPQVVARFVERGDYSGSLALQRQLLEDYEEDIRKYAEGLDQTKIIRIFRSIPAQLAKENKKFRYSLISKSARAREYEGCVEWLSDAGVVSVCRCLNFPELPLKGNTDDVRFKLYLSDTGLLVASLDEEAQEDLRSNRNLGVYKGGLYENMVAEALSKQGYGLFYYKREDSQLEQDFFVRTHEELIPVEVKSGNNKAKSLTTLINSGKYPDIRHGIKLAKANIGKRDGVHTFPYFCAFLLKRFLAKKV